MIFKFLSDTKYLKLPEVELTNNGFILISHESNRKGASILVDSIAKELRDKGADVFIISRQFGELNKEYSRIVKLRVVFSKCTLLKTVHYLSQKGYNKVIVNTVMNGDIVPALNKEKLQVVSLIHETVTAIDMLLAQKELKNILEFSNVVCFPTNLLKQDIEKAYGFDCSKVNILPQGLYLKTDDNNINCEKSNSVLCVGSTNHAKGFDLFIKLASLLPDDIVMNWVGKRDTFFDRIVKEYGGKLPGNFKYLGQLSNDELLDVYRKSKVYALMSRFDTFPSVMLEAMNTGTPVIGFKCSGGIVELVVNMKNGYLIENIDNLQEFAYRITQFIDMPCNQYKDISQICRSTASSYSFDSYVGKIIKLSGN